MQPLKIFALIAATTITATSAFAQTVGSLEVDDGKPGVPVVSVTDQPVSKYFAATVDSYDGHGAIKTIAGNDR